MGGKRWRKQIHSLTPQEWEAVCEQCGRCCYERTLLQDGTLVAIGAPCPHLDTETHACRVYLNRFETMPDCKQLTPNMIERPRFLPMSCAYRRLSESLREGGRS